MAASIPVSGLMTALSYLDAFLAEWLPTNLIQAQRDYFGAHTYRRIDREGISTRSGRNRAIDGKEASMRTRSLMETTPTGASVAVHPDADSVALAAATVILEEARGAVKEKGRFR